MCNNDKEASTDFCKCLLWARLGGPVVANHHPACEHYDLAGDARKIVLALLAGIEDWASDEDGVHPDCWRPYQNARLFCGLPPKPEGGEK